MRNQINLKISDFGVLDEYGNDLGIGEIALPAPERLRAHQSGDFLPSVTTPAEAQETLRWLSLNGKPIPYYRAVELFKLAVWEIRGSWLPVGYLALRYEEAVRQAKIRAAVTSYEPIMIVLPDHYDMVNTVTTINDMLSHH